MKLGEDMTAVELLDKLSEFAERVHGMIWADGWHDLDEIADRLEEELSEIDRMLCDGTVHPVDDEDCAAAMWVREHGGLKTVNGLLDWVVGHCSTKQQLDFDFWLSGRVMHELGFEEDVADRDEVERRLLARLMPEGMEWPRFEDGEPVRIGDEFMGKDGKTYTVQQVQFIGKCFSLYDFCDRKAQFNAFYGERVKRPAPKALDADGAEIGIGDKLYDTETGCACIVRAINANGTVEFEGHEDSGWFTKFLTHRAPVLAADGKPLEVGQTVYVARYEYQKCTVLSFEWMHDDWLVEVENEGGHKFRLTPDEFTHQHPVLDADGKPLREGEHVYHVETGAELVVKELPKPEEYQAVVVFAPSASHLTSFDPDQLTHERPDSWERMEEDASKEACEYFAHMPCGCETSEMLDETVEKCNAAKARDLVRRAKKLAGVSDDADE